MTLTPEDVRSVEWYSERGAYVATTELFPYLRAEHFDKDIALRKLATLIRKERES